MSNSSILHMLPLAVFAGLVLLAAEQDIREQRIANRLNLALALLAPAHWLGGTLLAAGGALALSASVLLLGAIAFNYGWIGGGDVKMLAATSLWVGLDGVTILIAVAAVAGGVGAFMALLIRLRKTSLGHAIRAPMPYGPAIAVGALVAVITGPRLDHLITG
jgi:prepilin peptidase CpaA